MIEYYDSKVEIEGGKVYVFGREVRNPVLKAFVKLYAVSFTGFMLLFLAAFLLIPLVLIALVILSL